MLNYRNLSSNSIEKSGKTVDDAILAALNELGVTKDDVTVDIIDEGKNGFLGIGRKDAVVKVSVKESVIANVEKAQKESSKENISDTEKSEKPVQKSTNNTAAPAKPLPKKDFTPRVQEKKVTEAPKPAARAPKAAVQITELKGEVRSKARPEKPIPPKPIKQDKLPPEQRSVVSDYEVKAGQPAVTAVPKYEKKQPYAPKRPRRQKPVPTPVPETKQEERIPTPKKISGIPPEKIAEDFLTNIFSAMQLEVNVTAQMTAEDTLLVNLVGDSMGIIIGKRGDTLDSLQYLTSLVINRQTENYIKVTLDTENYREKRSEALLALSNRLAERVARTGKKFTLEPMCPYERRIIHASLQDSETVTTFSIGVEPYRKVVISPKYPRKFRRAAKPRPIKKSRRPYSGYKASARPESDADKEQKVTAEKKGSYTTTYKADFKPQQHKAEFKSFDDYLKAHEGE